MGSYSIQVDGAKFLVWTAMDSTKTDYLVTVELTLLLCS
ncbi:hypothetical protein HJ01_02502 [Flavobacterium frigoris PS1]|uniref:Uncharacterized protein n=1 Tax=Flavobacterium frigoris (strain PS1) TaxID=1086011 RepID=H7FSD7_FLAFP|nr:hypothetical protein HJ01_02502 [Flavobacterium frigoris PS1]